jgi:hypothetical protein
MRKNLSFSLNNFMKKLQYTQYKISYNNATNYDINPTELAEAIWRKI